MLSWIAAIFFLTASPAASRAAAEDEKAPQPEGKAEKGPGDEEKKGGAGGKTGAAKDPLKPEVAKEAPRNDPPPSVPAPPPRPTPRFKTPQAAQKFQEGLKKLEGRDYAGARATLSACLKDASSLDDKKLLQGAIDDTKLGSEMEAARGMADRKEERKALARVEKALKAYPQSVLRPLAEKLIREIEEQICLLLDDFEPGGSLQRETEGKDEAQRTQDRETSKTYSRWRNNQSYNSDPRFVKHGKGSMKWRVGGDFYGNYNFWYNGWGYQSHELKNPITKWRYLVFWVYLPDAEDGSLRVTLSPEQDMSAFRSQYSKKFVDLRGKRGWMEVRLDLTRDFGNTANIKLEDVRYVRIEYLHLKYRTIYLDFVHLE